MASHIITTLLAFTIGQLIPTSTFFEQFLLLLNPQELVVVEQLPVPVAIPATRTINFGPVSPSSPLHSPLRSGDGAAWFGSLLPLLLFVSVFLASLLALTVRFQPPSQNAAAAPSVGNWRRCVKAMARDIRKSKSTVKDSQSLHEREKNDLRTAHLQKLKELDDLHADQKDHLRATYQQELTDLQARCTKEKDELARKIDKVAVQLDNSQRNLSKSQAQINTLQHEAIQFREVDKKAAERRKEMDSLRKERDDLKHDIQKRDEQLHGYQRDLTKAQSKAKEAAGEIEELQKQLKAGQEQSRMQSAHKNQLQCDLEAAQAISRVEIERVSKLEEQLQASQEQSQVLSGRISVLEHDLQVITNNAAAEAGVMQAELYSLEHDLRSTTEEKDHLVKTKKKTRRKRGKKGKGKKAAGEEEGGEDEEDDDEEASAHSATSTFNPGADEFVPQSPEERAAARGNPNAPPNAPAGPAAWVARGGKGH